MSVLPQIESKEQEDTIITCDSSITDINNLFTGFLSHQSTWMVVRDPERAKWLKENACGTDIMPIRLRVDIFGVENPMTVYNQLDLYSFLQNLSAKAGKPLNELIIKSVEDGKFKNLTNKFKNPEVMKVNSLKDMEIKDGTSIFVTVKGEN